MMHKLTTLKNNLKKLQKVGIAFSGGVDSSFLLKVALDTLGRENVTAFTAQSVFFPKKESEDAIKIAKALKANHELIWVEPLNFPQIVENPPRRCYYCKKQIMKSLMEAAEKMGYQYLLDGANQDDLQDFRPGQEAAKELGVLSPLQEAQLGEQEIRKLSKELDLITWEKPSFACLASRIPYGTIINEKLLKQIELGEDFLFSLGFKQIRLRYHEEIARLEISQEDFPKLIENRAEIVENLKKLGFKYITMDLEGYRTGSLNENIKIEV